MIQTHTSLDPAELQRASADLGARGKTAVTVPCNISDRRQVETMVEASHASSQRRGPALREPRWLSPIVLTLSRPSPGAKRSAPISWSGRVKAAAPVRNLGRLVPPLTSRAASK
jgi:hypothetical protein